MKLTLNSNYSFMKKILSGGLAIVMASSFTACSIKEDKQEEANTVPQTGIEETQDKVLYSSNYNFDDLTVVLGGNSDVRSIVGQTSYWLENIGVKVYISDSTKLTSQVFEQAALENPNDDIIGINIGGVTNHTGDVIVMANYSDGMLNHTSNNCSDSLAVLLQSSISNSKLVHGQKIVGYDVTERGKTDFESSVKALRLRNPGIKTVTIAVDKEGYLGYIQKGIENAIVKYESLNREERDKTYIGMLGFYPERTGSVKYGTNNKASDYQSTIEIEHCKACDNRVVIDITKNKNK